MVSEGSVHRPVVVVGRGRLGTSLYDALTAAGIVAMLVPGRDRDALGAALAKHVDAVVMLAVPDPAISEVAASITRMLPTPSQAAFVHLSGGARLDRLAPLAAAGYAVGAFHPLQSFPRVRRPEAFRGSTFGIDASTRGLLTELSTLAELLGGLPRRVLDDERALYHAAGAIAANHVIALAGQASSLLEAIGWTRPECIPALVPLMSGAVDNLAEHGLPGALTGPIRRGDSQTVAAHLDAIHYLPAGRSRELSDEAYRAVARLALELAVEAGLDRSAAEEIAEVLDD